MYVNVLIRIANIGDIEKILVLEKQVYEIHSKARPDWINKFPLNYNYIEDLLQNNNNKIFLAEENGKIIGFCIINIRKIKEHHLFHDMKILEIDDICIDQKCRKRGIGKLFFEEAKRVAKEINAKFIELMVWEFNQDAIKFYEKMGMKTRIRRMEYQIEK
jgi:ribosomal protein S18 acetylase RimI-like enzyme